MTPNLSKKAIDAMNGSYAPYSNFHVGAALLCGGQIFTGANIENASHGLTICAERVAIFKAVFHTRAFPKEGAGICMEAANLLIVTDAEAPSLPCGACLQVMAEFFGPRFKIVSMITKNGKSKTWTLQDLFPHPFKSR